MRKLLAAIIALGLTPAAWAEEDPAPAPAQTPKAEVTPARATEKDKVEAKPASAASALVNPADPTGPSASLAAVAGGNPNKKFRVGLSLGNSMRVATFAGPEHSDFVGSNLSVAPSYSFEAMGLRLAASASASASFEYTTPDNSMARRFNWNDVGLNLSAPGIYKNELTGISLSPTVGLTVPVSRESLWRGSITNMTAGLGVGRQFGKLNLGARIGGSKTLYAQVTQTLSDRQQARRDEAENQIFVCRSDQASCLLRGVPTLWALSGGVSASYSLMDKLTLSLGLNLAKRRTFTQPVDEYSSKIQDSAGQSVVTGTGEMDTMMGSIGASYRVMDTVTATFSYAAAQGFWNSENERVNFPWHSDHWTGPYNSLQLGLSTSF